MINWKAQLEATAFTKQQFPLSSRPEIAFVGRSNVGKSSLINKLIGQKLAHVSSTPGKTRSINFFRVQAPHEFTLVDLPGFGYASRSKGERRSWADLIETYLASRRGLALIVHLVDLRHGLLENDSVFQEWAKNLQVPLQVVFTKADKIARSKRKGLAMTYVRSGMLSWGAPVICSINEPDSIEALKLHLDQYLADIMGDDAQEGTGRDEEKPATR